MGSEAMVPEWASEPCIMGIDEAGRGPVLGPMVYGCLYCPLSYKKTLATLSFADSKTLKEEKREELFEALKGNDSIGWAVDVIDPKELSAKMLKKNKINLNEISHDSAMGLVDRVLKIGVLLTEVYIDTVGDPGKYEAKMSKNFPSIKFVVAKKADSLYPVVSGASIAAKGYQKLKMVEKGAGGRKEEVVTREYTINLHKRLHGCSLADLKGSSKSFPKHETRHLSEHKNVARCAKFSPDGRFVATGSADTSIKLFEVSKIKQTLLPDAKDGPVRFFDVSKANAKRSYRLIQDTHNVRSVSFHPSGDFLLAATTF
ncbi:Cleavage stimulation factor subunit 50 [Lathyrus oleraceus]|uniref:Ribonuclease n=1 Tax=Pisum sativum TaxID=3888 RepID=A0A9D4YIC1_PEA|nr:Cleavage stimulation factor subunit 50 [Pisum sativum]